jgi:hypothetical protein
MRLQPLCAQPPFPPYSGLTRKVHRERMTGFREVVNRTNVFRCDFVNAKMPAPRIVKPLERAAKDGAAAD